MRMSLGIMSSKLRAAGCRQDSMLTFNKAVCLSHRNSRCARRHAAHTVNVLQYRSRFYRNKLPTLHAVT